MKKLTTEQMVAWLTLEGWEYRPSNWYWFDSISKGDRRVLYDKDFAEVAEESWRNGEVDGPYPFAKPCSIDDIPLNTLLAFYNYLQEKQND